MKSSVEYNKLYDLFLADNEVKIDNFQITTYITDDKELKFIQSTFDILTTNEISDKSEFMKYSKDNAVISSIKFPSALVSFIKSMNSKRDKNKFIDQFRLNALLYCLDIEDGHYGIRDFFCNGDILELKNFFAVHKSKIMDFMSFQTMYNIICSVEIINDDVNIYDIDYFENNAARWIAMTKHFFTNPFSNFTVDESDKIKVRDCIKKYFTLSEDGETVCTKLIFCDFLEDLIRVKIPKNLLEFLDVYILSDDALNDYMIKNQIEDFEYFLNIAKNNLFIAITNYDMNPLFMMNGNGTSEFDFVISTEFVKFLEYKPTYKWQNIVEQMKNIEERITEFVTVASQTSVYKGTQYEKFVIEIMTEKYSFALEEHVGGSGDGGVDLIMIDKDGKRVAIQCKFISKGIVGSKVVGEIFKGMTLKKADYGMICTNSTFSSKCQKESDELGIKLERIKTDYE